MNKTKWIIQLTNRYSPIVIAMIGYISLAIFYTLVLKYDFSDLMFLDIGRIVLNGKHLSILFMSLVTHY